MERSGALYSLRARDRTEAGEALITDGETALQQAPRCEAQRGRGDQLALARGEVSQLPSLAHGTREASRGPGHTARRERGQHDQRRAHPVRALRAELATDRMKELVHVVASFRAGLQLAEDLEGGATHAPSASLMVKIPRTWPWRAITAAPSFPSVAAMCCIQCAAGRAGAEAGAPKTSTQELRGRFCLRARLACRTPPARGRRAWHARCSASPRTLKEAPVQLSHLVRAALAALFTGVLFAPRAPRPDGLLLVSR